MTCDYFLFTGTVPILAALVYQRMLLFTCPGKRKHNNPCNDEENSENLVYINDFPEKNSRGDDYQYV